MAGRNYFAAHSEPNLLIVEVLRPVGSLADDSVLQELDALVATLKAEAPHAVIVDFHQVDYFGSSLLEALRVLWRQIEPNGGRMALCNLSTVGKEIIELARFDHVWTVAADLPTARHLLEVPLK